MNNLDRQLCAMPIDDRIEVTRLAAVSSRTSAAALDVILSAAQCGAIDAATARGLIEELDQARATK